MSEPVKRHRARPRPLPDAGVLRPWIDSWELALRSENKSPKTIRGYLDAATRMAGWLLDPAICQPPIADWSQVTRQVFQRYMVWFQDTYNVSYANNQYRALQQFWKWYAAEEDVPNPMIGTRPPKAGDSRVVPVPSTEEMAGLIKDAEKGRDFLSRRDTAILRFVACTGCRLAEVAGLRIEYLNLRDRSARVIGKGGKERLVRYDYKCAQAIDRYLRLRTRHKYADSPHVWLGDRNRGPLTGDGIYQMISRRGERLGIHLYPHMFRHTFSHNWLDAGGQAGDLMELNGWSSEQMLRRYGASARSARARRHYDQIDVMGGV